MSAAFKEGDAVMTEHNEPATIYMLHPDGTHAVLTMDEQYMQDGGPAFRTVECSTLTRRTQVSS